MDTVLQQRLLRCIDGHEAEMIEFWKKLVRLESPSHYKAGVDAVGQVLAQFCKERLGYHIRFQEDPVYGNCLAACSVPFEEYRGGVALSAHMDTVHAVGSFPEVLREDAEYLYGPGAGDCKGGIVMGFLAMDALYQCGFRERPVHFILQSDEEVGSSFSKKETIRFMCEKSKNSAALSSLLS